MMPGIILDHCKCVKVVSQGHFWSCDSFEILLKGHAITFAHHVWFTCHVVLLLLLYSEYYQVHRANAAVLKVEERCLFNFMITLRGCTVLY